MQHILAEGIRMSWRETAEGTGESFAALVSRQSRFSFRIANAILRNTHDSEDVVQEVFLRLFKSRSWETIVDEKAFVARVTWRIAVRRLKRRSAALPDIDLPSCTRTPEETVIVADLNEAIHRLIDALPEDLRQPLALSTVDELTSQQISLVMGIPEGTVRSRLMRAREILKQKAAILLGRTK